MSKPIVAIVGRPNVGKSTLVNRIAETKEAIVHESRGVTRDRSYHNGEWNGVDFTIIDTGGIELGQSEDVFQESIRNQALMAADEADVIIFVVDSTTGITDEDEEVAQVLRRSNHPILLAVNKMDNTIDESPMYEFYALGLGDLYPISANHGTGTGDLLDSMVEAFPVMEPEVVDPNTVSIAIIGRPNAGKSSLANRLLGKNRSIVSDIAGTTRDAIDTLVVHQEKTYRIIDTAGLRKKSVVHEDVEYYSYVRALKTIDRADVALLIVDSVIGITDQDQRVAAMADERGTALIILLNKWDLLETPEEREKIIEEVEMKFQFVNYAPLLRISALTGRSIVRIWDIVDEAAASRKQIISTSKLNNLLTEMREFGHTINQGKKRLRMQYITQTGTEPPFFTIFVNHPEIIDDNYKRYIINRLRDAFKFTATPIRIKFRKKD